MEAILDRWQRWSQTAADYAVSQGDPSATADMLRSLDLWRLSTSVCLFVLGGWIAVRLARKGLLTWPMTMFCILFLLLGLAHLGPLWRFAMPDIHKALILAQATSIAGWLTLSVWALFTRDINDLLDYIHGCIEHREEIEQLIIQRHTDEQAGA